MECFSAPSDKSDKTYTELICEKVTYIYFFTGLYKKIDQFLFIQELQIWKTSSKRSVSNYSQTKKKTKH